MPTTTTNLPVLRINYLTSQQYQDALENNLIDENQLYLTPSSGQSEGSTISIERILTTGTAIATIEVDDVEYTLMAPTPPTTTSDLTNDSNFVSDANYVHTDNNFTTTLKNKLDGITAGATVDDHKWNDVSLTKSLQTFLADTWIPQLQSNNSTEAKLVPATVTPDGYKLAKYNNGYLISTTPTAGDNSTKVATTAFVSSAISALGSVLNYKGTKATTSALPTTGNTVGDVWHVTADSGEYAWDGSTWQELGSTIDLSGYVPTSRTVNGKALSANISLTASDVGALPSSTSVVNDLQYNRTQKALRMSKNGSMSDVMTVAALKEDLALTASDVGALPSSTTYVSSFNGDTGAITYTAPVTSVNGNTGAVTTTDEKLITNALSQDSSQTGYTMILGQKNATASTKYYDPGLDYANRNDEHTARLTIGVSGTDDNRRQGQVAFYNQNKYCILRNSSTTNSGYYINLPDSGGTLALTTAIPSASTSTPIMDGTASVGSSTSWAKGDHVHPTDTSRQAKITVSGILKGDGSGGVTAATAGTDYQAAGNYKTTQTAKTDPTAGSTGATSFIATITQNANGEITATKEPVTFPVTSVNGQTGAITVVEDDQTWNGIALSKSGTIYSGSMYLAARSSTSATTAYQIEATTTPGDQKIAMYNSNSYLNSTTPSANDNSTKVATTAYVDSAMITKPTVIISSTQPSSANSGDVWFKISS